MAIMVRDSGGGHFELPDDGIQNAICTAVFDLGDQPGFGGKIQQKVVIAWELEQKIREGEHAGEPFVVSRMFTASLHEKASLRAMLESWRGRAFNSEELDGFDLERLVSVPCLLSIVHNERDGKTFANVSAVMKHDARRYDVLSRTLPDDWMPNWVKNKLAEPLIVSDAPSGKPDNFEDDIPF